jgi:ubiquinone biosynthesis protein
MEKQKKKIKRTLSLIRILSKYGFGELIIRSNLKNIMGAEADVEIDNPLNPPGTTVYERVRMVLEELGPTYIKFGQAFSSREDLLPAELILELQKLQDRVEPADLDVKQLMADELGIDPDEYFSFIDPLPLASASISQVYRATLNRGEPVILKIKRTAIREVVEADLLIMKDVARLLVAYSDNLRRINLVQVLEAFEKSIHDELSFLREIANMEQFARNFEGNKDLHALKSYRELSNDNVLCMEFIAGMKVTDREALQEHGLDPRSIARKGLELYLTQILEHGFFHADPHPGNLFVLSTGQIAFIDFGSMGSMMPAEKELLENFIMHFIAQDAGRLVATIKKMAIRADIKDEKKLEREIHGIFDLLNGSALQHIDVKVVLTQFSNVLNNNEILMPDHLYLLIRGIVLIEGIGRKLDPDMNIVANIKPYVAKIIQQRLSPEYLLDKGLKTLRSLSEGMIDLPDNVKSIMDKLNQGELKIVQEVTGLPELKSSLDNGFNRLGYAIVIAGLSIAAALLMVADKPPKIFNIPAFGLFGVIISGVLGLAFIFSVLRKK